MKLWKPKKHGEISLVPYLLPLLAVVVLLFSRPTLACHRVYFGEPSLDNIGCKCNATHCDHKLNFEWPSNDDDVYIQYLSSKAGARFERSLLRAGQNKLPQVAGGKEAPAAAAAPATRPQLDYVLEVQVNNRRQQVMGFGGAFTDSASQLLINLGDRVREHALEDYFGRTGLQYNLGRIPIGGTDMSARPYSYNDDLPEGETHDLQLKHFKLQPEDLLYKVPLIKRANQIRRLKLGQEELKLMAASWSAPSWMKSNRHLVQGRLLGNSSSGPYYDAYARYQIKFLQEYEKLNLTMWALSPQNEPHSPKRVGPLKINFNSVNFEPEEMADYLSNSLVPNLIRSGKTADKLKLFIWDDTLDGLASYQRAALASPDVRDFTLGLALHWYTTGLNEKPYSLLYEARQRLPQKYCMMTTEASFIGRPRPGEWWRGERYARDLIENLRAGSVGWIDWNLALNMSGGPTWSNNILDSAILVDPEQQTYYKNPMYYALGHLSRFIEPKSYILQSAILKQQPAKAEADHQHEWEQNGNHRASQTGSGKQEALLASDELAMVAAELEEPLRLDGGKILKRRLALVVLNRAKQTRRVQLALAGCHLKSGHPSLELELEPSSLISLAFVC